MMPVFFDALKTLEGKTVDVIDRDDDDQFAVVHFTDGTMWLVTARRWNAAGVRVEHQVGRRCDSAPRGVKMEE